MGGHLRGHDERYSNFGTFRIQRIQARFGRKTLMDTTLSSFIRALRVAGAEVSTGEAIDAARAVAFVGYDDRADLKASLGLVLAKSVTEKAIHDRVFDLFFAAPAAPDKVATDASDTARTGAEAEGGARDDGAGNDADSIDTLMSQIRNAGGSGSGSDRLAARIAEAAQAASVDDIRFPSQIPYFVRQTMERMGIAPLEARLREHLLVPTLTPAARDEAAALAAARDSLQRFVRALVDQRFALFGKPATENFLAEIAVNRQLGRLASSDLERMKTAVARMAKRLAVKHSRRRRIASRGKLDLRRTLRANAGHDGVPFELRFKFKRRDKPRIVAICDVSASVAPQVHFLLLFLYALRGTVTDLSTFAFSNSLHDIAVPLDTLPFDDAMAFVVNEYGSGSTDYGQALTDFAERHWDLVDRRTTVLILGDGRSNNTDPRLDIFRELSERAKRVVWLCPEPVGRWGTGDSCMLQYRTFANHVGHCTSAADIERAIDEALAAYA